MKQIEQKRLYVISLVFIIVFIIYGCLSGLHFSSYGAVKSKINDIHSSIDKYEHISQGNYDFYLCKKNERLEFIRVRRWAGILWYIDNSSALNINERPITFDIMSYGKSSSILFGKCDNNVSSLKVTLSNDKKKTFEVKGSDIFMFHYKNDGLVWTKVEAFNKHNEVIWASDKSN